MQNTGCAIFFYWKRRKKRRKTWAVAMLFTQQTLRKVWLHITIKEHIWEIQHEVRTSDKVEGAANIQKTFNTFTPLLRTVVFEHTTVWLWRVSLHGFRSYPVTELNTEQFYSTFIFPLIIYSSNKSDTTTHVILVLLIKREDLDRWLSRLLTFSVCRNYKPWNINWPCTK